MVDNMYLTWNNHDKMIGITFQNLYEDDVLTDFTLCCTEGSVRAHKLVMAACSPYFRKIFKDHPDIRMAVMVKGVRLQELKILLEFMYKGRVRVGPDQIDRLARVAEELGVDEFNSSVDLEIVDGGSIDAKQRFFQKLNMSVKKERILDSENLQSTINGAEAAKPDVDHSSKVIHDRGGLVVEQLNVKREHISAEGGRSSEDYHEKIKRNLICKLCFQKYKTTRDLSVHIKSHLKNNKKPFMCDYCPSSFKRSSHLSRHKLIHTGERPFICNQCPKSFSRLDKLKQHIRNAHECPTENDNDYEGYPTIKKKKTSDSSSSTNINTTIIIKKRSRGRPRKHPVGEIVNDGSQQCSSNGSTDYSKNKNEIHEATQSNTMTGENYNLTNLPFGDLTYLTMPEDSPDSPNMLLMEPLVEISTTNDNAEPSSQPTSQSAMSEATLTSDDTQTYGQIGDCTVSVSSSNKK